MADKEYPLGTLKDWYEVLESAFKDYKTRFQAIPLAVGYPRAVLSRIYVIMNQDKSEIIDDEGRNPSLWEFVHPGSIRVQGFLLEVWAGEDLPEDRFVLIGNPDPDPGEEEPVYTLEESLQSQRRIG